MTCSGNNCGSQLEGILEHKNLYTQYETSDEKLTWCSGCGNYGIQKALIRALTLENIPLENVLFCFDIGCNGNGSDKLSGYTIHGLHGRVLPLAAGAALANRNMKVIAIGGDGATFSEGVNHLVHSVRSNYPVTFLCHNNENYGLTTGQASAATRRGIPMNGSPDGVPLEPINACQFVLSLHPTFVGRAFSGDQKNLTEVIRAGLRHDGFSFLEIMQLCPTYNKYTSAQWFWDRIVYADQKEQYDKTDIWQARRAVEDLENEILMGVVYEKEAPNFYDRLVQREHKQTILTEEVAPYDIEKLVAAFV